MRARGNVTIYNVREHLLTKNGKLTRRAEQALATTYYLLIGKPIYTYEVIGSGRHRQQRELLYLYELELIIEYLGLKIFEDNNAPRGGKLGNHIKIKRKRNRKQALRIRNDFESKITKKKIDNQK